MSRRDYIVIAAALANIRPAGRLTTGWRMWAETRDEIANCLKRDNASFDRARFDEATER